MAKEMFTFGLDEELVVQRIEVCGLGRALAGERDTSMAHLVPLRRQALIHL